MKRFLTVILPIALLVAACSKEKSLEVPGNSPGNPGGGPDTTGQGGGGGGGGTGTYFMTAKQDGAAVTFNEDLSAEVTDSMGMKVYSISGFKSPDPSNFEGFFITIMSATALTPGTYSISDITSGNLVVAVYLNSTATVQYGVGTGFTPPGDPFSVTITAVSATEIAGSFTGKVYELSQTTGQPDYTKAKSFTEGAFKVEIQ